MFLVFKEAAVPSFTKIQFKEKKSSYASLILISYVVMDFRINNSTFSLLAESWFKEIILNALHMEMKSLFFPPWETSNY